MIFWFEQNYKLSWMITIFIALIIFYTSSLTAEETAGVGVGYNAVLYHIIVFFLLSFFLFISLVRGKKKDLIIFGAIFAFLFAILDEIHQFFVPGRSSTTRDVMLDSVGILFAIFFYLLILKYRDK